MNRLLLSATATLFAGQALGHSEHPLSIAMQIPGFEWISAIVLAGMFCYAILRFRR
ncbi:MAG: hypothetical protein CENE_03269 [Candidatus Celerinatantimonas neptuna]|nr:MAG: hypothetical protein CENE_03269 [Candidatus Celerinatantimonas neptuna]